MKRVAAFLLLFTGGIALLVLFDETGAGRADRGGASSPAGAEADPDRAPEGTEPAAEEPRDPPGTEVPPQEPEPSAQSVQVRGRTLLEFFDLEAGHLQRRLRAEDLQPEGDAARTPYTARGVVLEEFEPDRDQALRTVRAEAADLVLDLTSGLAAPVIAERGEVTFTEVELVQERDLPQAPVTIRAAEVRAELERGVYSSPPEVEVEVDGVGLRAEGRGLLFEAARSMIEFPGGGTVDLVQAGERRGVLSTAEGAALVLARGAGADQEAFGIQTLGPSVLALEAEIPLQVDADRFTVATRSVAGVVSVEEVRAPGAIAVSRGEDRFSGAGATVTFDGAGASRLVIDADAVASISVEGPEGERRPLTFRGAQGMVLRDGPQGLRFQMAGPFTVTDATGAELTVEGSGEGLLDPARTELDLRLAGRSTYRSGETELVMGSATLRHLAGDLQMLQLEAEGGVEARARATDGDLVELLADAWSLELRGEAPRILWADAVQARSLSGLERSLVAGRVEDFRWDARAFLATGGVQWALAEGAGRGERLTVRGDGLEIVGTREARATLRFVPDGGATALDLEAVRIDATATSVEAWGDVRLDATGPTGDSGMLAEHVRVDERAGPESSTLTVLAERVREGLLQQGARTVALEAELLELSLLGGTEGAVTLESFRASGEVGALVALPGALRIEADVLEGSGGTEARATALPGRRVRAEGLLPGTEDPFVLAADELTLGAESIRAARIELELGTPLVPIGSRARPVAARAATSRLLADLLTVTPTETVLQGGVLVETQDLEGVPVQLEAQLLRLATQDLQDVETVTLDSLKAIDAEGAVRLRYGDGAVVEASALRMDAQRLRVTGNPVVLESMGYEVRTDLVELDLTDFLLELDAGTVTSGPGWGLRFAGVLPHRMGGDLLQTMHGVTFEVQGQTARANHAAFWLHPGRWRRAAYEALWGRSLALDLEEDPGPGPAPPLFESGLVNNTFQRLARGELARYVRAAHFAGSVEVDREGERSARAEEVYLDVEHQRGWLAEAELAFEVPISGRSERLRAFAKRLDSLPNGGLVAEEATLTTCSFEEPHYVIQSRDLRLEPRDDGRWRFGVRGNRLVFPLGLSLPLPGIGDVVLDDEGGFEGFEDGEGQVRTIQNIFLSSTARFGTALGTEGTTEVGSLGLGLAEALGFDGADVRGRWLYEGAWLGSRGPLLGLGLQLREARPEAAEQDAWLDLWLRGIPDDGEDRGLIRIPASERDGLRSWLYARGRYPFDDQQWLDFVWTRQSDPGVQSEFFEREYLAYEQRDTYLHWRKARGDEYLQANVSVRSDPWRAELEEQPSVGYANGSSELGSFLGVPLLYAASADAARLHRRGDGDPSLLEEPWLDFDGLPDGYGDERVTRIDAWQELSAPLDLGATGATLVPSLEFRASAWDRSRANAGAIQRAGALAGLELGGSWSRFGAGTVTLLAPYARVTSELWTEEEDAGELLRFDRVEDPLGGDRLDAGFRMRWRRPSRDDQLDLELGLIQHVDRPLDAPDLEAGRALARLQTTVSGVPTGLLHDGRYGLDGGATAYSATTFAVRPVDGLELQLSHNRADDPTAAGALYEAITYRGRVTLGPKWEVDLLTQDNIAGEGALRSEAVLRRLGHDFVLELSFSNRAGEGSGVSINFAPLLGWRRPRVSILPVLDR